jgi:hypothetical protein
MRPCRFFPVAISLLALTRTDDEGQPTDPKLASPQVEGVPNTTTAGGAPWRTFRS